MNVLAKYIKKIQAILNMEIAIEDKVKEKEIKIVEEKEKD